MENPVSVRFELPIHLCTFRTFTLTCVSVAYWAGIFWRFVSVWSTTPLEEHRCTIFRCRLLLAPATRSGRLLEETKHRPLPGSSASLRAPGAGVLSIPTPARHTRALRLPREIQEKYARQRLTLVGSQIYATAEPRHHAVLVGQPESDLRPGDGRWIPLVTEAKQERSSLSVLRV